MRSHGCKELKGATAHMPRRMELPARWWGDRWDSNPQQPESQSGTLPLSYGHHINRPGLPDWTRTSDPQLRRLMLYPTELRADPNPADIKTTSRRTASFCTGRGERIRTSDPLRPRQVRYQAALRPEGADDTGRVLCQQFQRTTYVVPAKALTFASPQCRCGQVLGSPPQPAPAGFRPGRGRYPVLTPRPPTSAA